MWRAFDDRILYTSEGTGFEFIPLNLEEYQFDGALLKTPMPNSRYLGFDDWLQHFSPEEELSIVRNTLKKAQKDSHYRGHIQGISLAESAELLRGYYRAQ